METTENGEKPDYEPKNFYRFFELSLERWDLFDSVNLKRSKIVLASDLNPVIDFFNATEVGIGGRNAEQAAAELNLDITDERRLAAILRVRSYDVYTLRAALGNYLSPERFENLALPDEERRQLERYTREYTRALFQMIFEESLEIADRQSMRKLLEGSTRELVQQNVQNLATKFNIHKDELVNYIAGVGEMLLAVAFYRRAFEENRSWMQDFLFVIKKLHDDRILCMRHLNLNKNAYTMLSLGAQTMKILEQYFKSYEDIGKIWVDLTPEKFKSIRERVEVQYPTIGTILCIWQVKINCWNQRFHNGKRRATDNSPEQFAVFFQERIFPGFEKIRVYIEQVQSFGKFLP